MLVLGLVVLGFVPVVTGAAVTVGGVELAGAAVTVGGVVLAGGAVERVRPGTGEPEDPGTVPLHVVEDPERLRASWLDDPGGERVRHDQVPVAPL